MVTITKGDKGYSPVVAAELTADLRRQGWRECITSTPPELTLTEDQALVGFYSPAYTYNEEEDNFSQEWAWVSDPGKAEQLINELKTELANGDYMWVKCWEASIMGRSYPYSAEELTEADERRENIRKRINDIEKMLS